MEDSRLMKSMLLDFYGELLTRKQRECYDLHYNEDYSLSEIAEELNISRQGVWDIIRRAEKTLLETEEKTGLIRRFDELRAEVDEIEKLLTAGGEKSINEVLSRLEALKK